MKKRVRTGSECSVVRKSLILLLELILLIELAAVSGENLAYGENGRPFQQKTDVYLFVPPEDIFSSSSEIVRATGAGNSQSNEVSPQYLPPVTPNEQSRGIQGRNPFPRRNNFQQRRGQAFGQFPRSNFASDRRRMYIPPRQSTGAQPEDYTTYVVRDQVPQHNLKPPRISDAYYSNTYDNNIGYNSARNTRTSYNGAQSFNVPRDTYTVSRGQDYNYRQPTFPGNPSNFQQSYNNQQFSNFQHSASSFPSGFGYPGPPSAPTRGFGNGAPAGQQRGTYLPPEQPRYDYQPQNQQFQTNTFSNQFNEFSNTYNAPHDSRNPSSVACSTGYHNGFSGYDNNFQRPNYQNNPPFNQQPGPSYSAPEANPGAVNFTGDLSPAPTYLPPQSSVAPTYLPPSSSSPGTYLPPPPPTYLPPQNQGNNPGRPSINGSSDVQFPNNGYPGNSAGSGPELNNDIVSSLRNLLPPQSNSVFEIIPAMELSLSSSNGHSLYNFLSSAVSPSRNYLPSSNFNQGNSGGYYYNGPTGTTGRPEFTSVNRPDNAYLPATNPPTNTYLPPSKGSSQTISTTGSTTPTTPSTSSSRPGSTNNVNSGVDGSTENGVQSDENTSSESNEPTTTPSENLSSSTAQTAASNPTSSQTEPQSISAPENVTPSFRSNAGAQYLPPPKPSSNEYLPPPDINFDGPYNYNSPQAKPPPISFPYVYTLPAEKPRGFSSNNGGYNYNTNNNNVRPPYLYDTPPPFRSNNDVSYSYPVPNNRNPYGNPNKVPTTAGSPYFYQTPAPNSNYNPPYTYNIPDKKLTLPGENVKPANRQNTPNPSGSQTNASTNSGGYPGKDSPNAYLPPSNANRPSNAYLPSNESRKNNTKDSPESPASTSNSGYNYNGPYNYNSPNKGNTPSNAYLPAANNSSSSSLAQDSTQNKMSVSNTSTSKPPPDGEPKEGGPEPETRIQPPSAEQEPPPSDDDMKDDSPQNEPTEPNPPETTKKPMDESDDSKELLDAQAVSRDPAQPPPEKRSPPKIESLESLLEEDLASENISDQGTSAEYNFFYDIRSSAKKRLERPVSTPRSHVRSRNAIPAAFTTTSPSPLEDLDAGQSSKIATEVRSEPLKNLVTAAPQPGDFYGSFLVTSNTVYIKRKPNRSDSRRRNISSSRNNITRTS